MKSFLKRTGVLCLLVLLLPVISYAEIRSGSCGKNVQWQLNTETGLLEIYNSQSGAYSNMSDYSRSSDVPWYSYRTYIRSVNLSGINNIGDYVFLGCSGLTSIAIPESVTSIGSRAFSGCNGLTSITIPESVTTIDSYTFYNCSSLTSIIIPESVTTIKDYTFRGCSALTSVTIPNSVSSIGRSAFSGCSSLASITIPESVTSIGDNTFYDCSGLTSIDIPQNVTSIGVQAFYGCCSLTSVTIPESVTDIGSGAFCGCSGLTSVDLKSNAIISATYSSEKNIGTIFGSQVKEYIIGEKASTIGEYAFSGCSGLTSITIPNSVISIGDDAFRGCSDLTSITIPNSVTSIGGSAFNGCSALTSVHITDLESWCNMSFGNVSSNPLYYAKHIYMSNQEIKDLVIPNSVASIGSYAFSGCSGLTSVTIPNSVTSIGYDAFSDCSSLTSITIPESVTSIKDYTFRGCSALTSVTIPNSVSSIGRSAFSGCSSLTSITIPNSVTSIGNYAFNGCCALTSITIPENVTSIGNSTFNGCSCLTSITIPENVTSIGSQAFRDCISLTSVELNSNDITSSPYSSFKNLGTIFGSQVKEYIIGDKISTIGDNAFYNCSEMISITLSKGVTSIGGSTFYGCNGITSVELNSNAIISATYSSSNNLGTIFGRQVKEYIIGDNISTIGEYAFSGCSGLTSITIPNSVTSIGDDAFRGCSGLTSITIPNSVTSIGDDAFRGCSGLTSLTIPNSVTSIGNFAFNGCSALISITIPENVTNIGNSTFNGCSSLTSLVIPNSVTSIGVQAFSGCSSLTSVIIPKSVTSIDGSAFNGCSALTSVHITDLESWCNMSFGNISSNPLYYAKHLYMSNQEIKDLVIPNSVASIGNYAFSGCNGLTSVNIPESVTSIGSSAFSYCSGLTSIIIPDSVTSIEGYTFRGCSALTSVTIPNSVTSIGYDAFSGCSSLTSITIPEKVTSIGSQAFASCSGLTSVQLNSNDITSATYSSEKNLGTIFGSQVKEYIIGDNISNIGNNAFYNCSEMVFVTLSKGVTNIGDNAFYDCSALASITIPESVTSIGCSAFYGCSGLTSVELNSNAITSATYSSEKNLGTIFGRQVKEYIIGDNSSTIGDYAFYNCGTLNSVTLSEGVTSIGNSAFRGCCALTSIAIPESVTSIGYDAFYDCSGLISIVIPKNVTNIGVQAFYGCRSLISISIPDNVTSIGNYAFYGCSGLETIVVNPGNPKYDSRDNCNAIIETSTNKLLVGCKKSIIPEGVKTIGDVAFRGCSGLTSITIPESVTSIGNSAFYGCSKLTSVTLKSNDIVSASRTSSTSMKSIFGTQVKEYMIWDAVKGIGDYAFFGCTELNSVTIPDNITSFGDSAFGECNNVIFYVNRGSDALLSVWSYGAEPYEIGTSQSLLPPSLLITSTTQTTLKCQIDNLYPELEYTVINSETIGNNEYMIKGLWPESEQTINLMVYSANNSYSTSVDTTTLPISPVMNEKTITASSISVKGSYTEGDAKIVSQILILNGEEIEGTDGTLYGLDPNTFYNCIYQVVVEDDFGDKHLYETSKDISTEELVLITQQPKVISAGNVIVAANSNLDDEEAEVGFEWRRTDWTDDFNSNTGGAYLYDGTMEGYIRNLYTEKLWKYRPYYESNSGNRYYGDWVGIDPTNTSYFEPTIHTYATTNVSGNKAEVKGYAMRGTDNVVRQGFMYWKNVPSSTRRYAKSIPANAMVVEAKGNVMVATLENLDYDTEYCYVAFMTTSENETFYGEEQTFKTGEPSQDVIDGIVVNEKLSMRNEESAGAVYDLNGRKLTVSQKGINIIRMSDGAVRKVLIK